jgi:hypothetical protein
MADGTGLFQCNLGVSRAEKELRSGAGCGVGAHCRRMVAVFGSCSLTDKTLVSEAGDSGSIPDGSTIFREKQRAVSLGEFWEDRDGREVALLR